MRFDVLTLFPEMFVPVLSESIIGRAANKGLINLNYINIRDFSNDKHRRVDDYPFGGGRGMVMRSEPIFNAYNSMIEKFNGEKPKVIYMSPQGMVLNQQKALQLSKEVHLIILCGHYEGVDQRVIDGIVDEEISIGDYVLTGGELAAMVLIDCVVRLIDGVLPSKESYINDSHFNGLLEFPQYTQPANFRGERVPEVLLSGHHSNIEIWRRKQSLLTTAQKRPELLKDYILPREGLTKRQYCELKRLLDELKNKVV